MLRSLLIVLCCLAFQAKPVFAGMKPSSWNCDSCELVESSPEEKASSDVQEIIYQVMLGLSCGAVSSALDMRDPSRLAAHWIFEAITRYVLVAQPAASLIVLSSQYSWLGYGAFAYLYIKLAAPDDHTNFLPVFTLSIVGAGFHFLVFTCEFLIRQMSVELDSLS